MRARNTLPLTFLILLLTGLVVGTQAADMEGWYAFQPRDSTLPGEIGMQDWIEAPAGKRGRIEMVGDHLVVGGKEIKLWGLNNTYATCAPENPLADQRAAWYAKMGFNSVRLHKYANGTGWRGICTDESFVEFNPDLLDRMDYFIAKMKEHGIYTKLSPSFGVRMGPGDRHYLPAYYDELTEGGKETWPRIPYGGAYFLPEMQQIVIDQMLNILNHTNPYTDLPYREDPAIAVIEIINEDSVLWFGPRGFLARSPFMKERAGKLFGDWLRGKYGTEEKLLAAWGDQALNAFASEGASNESWEASSILPFGHPGLYDPDLIDGAQAHVRVRLLDTMRFLYELQNTFYDRFVAAVREAGYPGPIVASNWQAGRMYSHYYNLHSDARIGIVDRHNYFGGGRDGNIINATMLAQAGSGTLSAGMQQVHDRPFMLSEWIHVWPNEWGVEGPALIGAYGMGLQGWDASYIFQNGDDGGYSDALGGSDWDVTAPQVAGIMPAVARQIYRGDVMEARLDALRYVHIPSLLEGRLDFEDNVTQQFDIKTFNSDKVPAETLAAARVAIAFTDEFKETPAFELDRFRDEKTRTIVSETGQLRWTESKEKLGGFFTIDTPGTKAVVGFAPGLRLELGEVTIEPASSYAAIYVTAAGPEETIAEADKLLVFAIARARNTGQEISEDGTKLIKKGKAPVLMEPVQARITIKRPGHGKLVLLDHDGLRTESSRAAEDGVVFLDGATDKTPFYVIDYSGGR